MADPESGKRRVYFCALEPEDHLEAIARLSERCSIDILRLEPQFLRRYERFPVEDCCVILCHMFDGRTLLTDRDGLYNSFLLAAADASRGDVFLALTGLTSATHSIASDDIVLKLVNDGQVSVQHFHAAQRFLTWADRGPSPAQIDLVAHPPPPLDLLPIAASMRHHTRSKSRANSSSSYLRCTLL